MIILSPKPFTSLYFNKFISALISTNTYIEYSSIYHTLQRTNYHHIAKYVVSCRHQTLLPVRSKFVIFVYYQLQDGVSKRGLCGRPYHRTLRRESGLIRPETSVPTRNRTFLFLFVYAPRVDRRDWRQGRGYRGRRLRCPGIGRRPLLSRRFESHWRQTALVVPGVV
ncbi:hypothetical protein BDQ17DRAFT_517959 [Cyathus striatus]|nr:hypothetical protein BDQ17DRAFT_517959 [Cyathus striatus]